MGNFKEHILFGIITSLILLQLYEQKIPLNTIEKISTGITILIGSVLPDIDHKNSYVYRATRATLSITMAILTIILAPFQIYENFAIGLIIFATIYTAITSVKIKHRGLTHTITFLLMITALTTVLARATGQNPLIALGLSLGMLSHLILDREFKFSP